MVISYDNLITRLWLSGAIMPFEKGGYASSSVGSSDGMGANSTTSSGAIDTLINEKGLPPVPHSYWVDRLGFQQDDPVTDFRSGGVSFFPSPYVLLCFHILELSIFCTLITHKLKLLDHFMDCE